MRYKIFLGLWLLTFSTRSFAQQTPGSSTTDNKHIRIVDTLSFQEKSNRNPVLLKTELDSLILQWQAGQPPQVLKEPAKAKSAYSNIYILAGIVVIIVLLGFLILLFSRQQQKINRTIAGLPGKEMNGDTNNGNGLHLVTKDRKRKYSPASLESRISDLDAELYKLSKENEGLNRVLKEYNGIQHEYDSLKHGMLKAYKVKNYPGYDKTKDETIAIQGVLDTEYAVATYAYEKFLKPVLQLTDANKNSPAKLTKADQEKLLDLLLSLSLLYIEYLYLRVNDLSIGGKMVERIQGLSRGKSPDLALLKKLNTEFGSRALVIRIALEKISLHRLSYPIFDETNLNNQ
ncbi:MAG: hypothetical protein ABIT05_02755 [Chitinophagaceae bacterium]